MLQKWHDYQQFVRPLMVKALQNHIASKPKAQKYGLQAEKMNHKLREMGKNASQNVKMGCGKGRQTHVFEKSIS